MTIPKLPRKWHWVLIVLFFVLSLISTWFGLLGFLCMGAPLFLALKGKGRRHCTHYCPRGSFLETFLKSISLDNSLPRFMKTKMFRHIMLVLMMTMFSFGIYHAWGDLYKIAFTIFRFMGVSFLFGLVLGFFTKPKSWCSICPMGHASTLISKKVKKTA